MGKKSVETNWRGIAIKYKLSKNAINRMEPAFTQYSNGII